MESSIYIFFACSEYIHVYPLLVVSIKKTAGWSFAEM